MGCFDLFDLQSLTSLPFRYQSQPLQEDSEVLFHEQGGYRKNIEYTYNGWFRIVIVFMNSLVNLVKYYL